MVALIPRQPFNKDWFKHPVGIFADIHDHTPRTVERMRSISETGIRYLPNGLTDFTRPSPIILRIEDALTDSPSLPRASTVSVILTNFLDKPMVNHGPAQTVP